MTVNVRDNVVQEAKKAGYHAYHANGITAIEIPTKDKQEAKEIASQFGEVLYVFE